MNEKEIISTMNRIMVVCLAVLFCIAVFSQEVYAEQKIVSAKVENAPVIDGADTDKVWAEAQKIVTRDKVAKIDITIKTVYTDKEIFFLVSFPDRDESGTHKSWVWDKEKNIYKEGDDREDVFEFKWNMESRPVDLSLTSDDLYRSDIWFWKACRTDPVGYADDKIDSTSIEKVKGSTRLTSRTGSEIYMMRKGDSGVPAFKSDLPTEYKGDVLPRFMNVAPTGSAADIKAKGRWRGGKWTIEYGRALITGNDDDVLFDVKKTYQFGVSRYEIAGLDIEPGLSQPLYSAGDVGEILTLVFAE